MIRPATKDDADILKQIHAECFSTYGNIESFNDFFSVDGTRALVAEEVASCELQVTSKDEFFSLATRNSQLATPVGMIVYRIAHEQADIITIAVLPAFRRQGIARALLVSALEHIASLGAKTIFLDVEDGNEAALSPYEKHGFTLLKRRKQYYKQKDGSFTDALVMMRKLPVASSQLPV